MAVDRTSRLPRHLAADPRCRAEFSALLAFRPAGQWSTLEMGQLVDLVARMAELRSISDRLSIEGLTVTNLAGRTTAHPLVKARAAAERAIRMARAGLGLGVSQGEARRHGRALALRGDDLGLLPDGTPTETRCYAFDPDGQLARPEDHDPAEELALRARLIAAGQMDPPPAST